MLFSILIPRIPIIMLSLLDHCTQDLQKKCQQCKEIIVSAKDRQAAEANKNATILLEELDKERQHEENRKAAAAKKRERKKAKRREKQQEKEKEP